MKWLNTSNGCYGIQTNQLFSVSQFQHLVQSDTGHISLVRFEQLHVVVAFHHNLLPLIGADVVHAASLTNERDHVEQLTTLHCLHVY